MFLKPDMEVVLLDEEDVIATSGGCGDATAVVPPMTSGDVDGCGCGPCGMNDVFFDD